jgi:hypothetical protein
LRKFGIIQRRVGNLKFRVIHGRVPFHVWWRIRILCQAGIPGDYEYAGIAMRISEHITVS